MKSVKLLLTLSAILVLSACQGEDEDDRFDVGYDDGLAAGYKETCGRGITLIEGDWDNEAYTRGYNAGYSDGVKSCRNENN